MFLTVILLMHCHVFSNSPQKNFAFKGYAGGMMLHTGYMKSADFNIIDQFGNHHNKKIEGMPFGIGGAVKFQFGNYFRFGTEGYTTKMTYDKFGSVLRQGWGGILVDGLYKIGRWTPFMGVFFGGGQITNLIFNQIHSGDYTLDAHVAYRQYIVFLFNPSLGFEVAITPKLSLVFKAEYQISLRKRESDQPQGVRFYLGMLFNRIKE